MIAVLANSMTEAQLQDAVEELAQWLGWRTFHDRDSRRNDAGLPDLVAVHRTQHRVLFAELKTTAGRLRTAQRAWLDDIEGTPAEGYLWRPEQYLSGEIEAILRGKP